MHDENLSKLEERSIYIIREAKAQFKNIAVLWSTGKDSTACLWLCRKAFRGKIPFPVIHLDTSYKFPEIYEFRDEVAKKWGLNLIVAKNEEALKNGMSPEKGRDVCCTALKTDALKKVIEENKFDAIIVSIRRDEHGIRAKERFFCLPEGSIVYGEKVKPIEDVNVGDFVFTHLGSPRKVLGVSRRPYKGPVLSIISEYNLPLLLTPNHVALAKVKERIGKTVHVTTKCFDEKYHEIEMPLTTRRIRWVAAKNLKIGDCVWMPKLPKKPQDEIKRPLFLPMKPFISNPENLIKFGRRLRWKSAHSSSPWIRESLPLYPDMLRILGYYIAEGSCNYESNQFSFSFNKKEDNLVEDLSSVMKEHFGIEGSEREKGENGIEVIFNSKLLMLAFSKLCGIGASNKKLPFFFTQLSKLQLIELLKGCWLGDGSWERYSTSSCILAHQLRLALLRLKTLSSIKLQKDERHALSIAGISKEKFANLFGIKSKTPYIGRCRRAKEVSEIHPGILSTSDYGRSRAGGFWVKIKEIKAVPYDGYVYDLNIDGHSSYLVGGIAVHNSPRDKNFKWDFKNQPPEMWDFFSALSKEASHVRVHPILHWTEFDVWRFVKQEGLPVNPLYFANYKEKGKRYRSLGCMPCTVPIESNADTIDKIVEELRTTKISERAGRAQDKERAYAMQKLRTLGYMILFLITTNFLFFKLL